MSGQEPCAPLVEIVPANVGHREAKGSIKFGDPARYDPQAFHTTIFLTAFKQKLHAQADAQEGFSCLQAFADAT